MISPKKLIEVALPLDAINAAAAREKSIRHGHPSTLHLWWARRPLAAARAVIFSQLVHDPEDLWKCQNPGKEPNPQQKGHFTKTRAKLFRIIEELVLWENTTNERVLEAAREEIRKSWRETCELNKDHPDAKTLFDPKKMPGLHDPFAGGGAIPLEAQRLGLEAFASDLNPVAVLINKAMIEIPPKFAGKPPVHPGAQNPLATWSGAAGLAEDVRRYGQWMRDEAFKRIGHLYPSVEITPEMVRDRPDLAPYVGEKLTVIAWLWARTVKSPNPAYSSVDVPLASTFILSSKEGKEAYVQPVLHQEARPSLGARVSRPSEAATRGEEEKEAGGTPALQAYHFTVKIGKPPAEAKTGTTAGKRAAFVCLMSKVPMSYDYIREEGKAGRMGQKLMAIVAEGTRGRVYLSPTPEHEAIAATAQPEWKPENALPDNPRDFKTPNYGMMTFGDLFTPRQLVALTTFSDLVSEARERIYHDALGARASRPPSPVHFRGYLPHWEAGEVPQAITFRSADSLPTAILASWEKELQSLPPAQMTSQRQRKISEALDQGHGECLLRNPEIATIVEHALLHFNETRYRLHAWCIMPNHVHVLLTPLHGNSLSSILHSWKSFTAKQINQKIGRTGAFWQEEYFDRMIRNDEHFANAHAYIEQNPVKAGLCERPEDWPFGSAAKGEEKRAGRPHSQDDLPLDAGGTGARAYAEAVSVYLGFGVDRLLDRSSSLCGWDSGYTKIRNTFGRQALPMVWDFTEGNCFSESTGNFEDATAWVVKVLQNSPASPSGMTLQQPAQNQVTSKGKIVSTDPPYYDNIGYADLSDFFYVWLRRSLRSVFPNLLATISVPKAEELVATPYRHSTKQNAEKFFLDGMTQAMRNLAVQAHPAAPITIYYAFKQSETGSAGVPPASSKIGQDGRAPSDTSSTGWETFLDAVLKSGLSLTGTWPMRTELGNRMISSGTNALASSIVLVCRPRAKNAGTISRRQFIRQLNEALPLALDAMTRGVGEPASSLPASQVQAGSLHSKKKEELGVQASSLPASQGQAGSLLSNSASKMPTPQDSHSPIAPVDLSQAIIGPGMAIFSRYDAVLEADGTPMTVKTALQLINRFLAEDDFDRDTQFCLHWFEQHGWEPGKFGEADVLARAKGTSVSGVQQAGVIEAGSGKVRLLKWKELDIAWDIEKDSRIPVWQTLHQMILAFHKAGDTGAGRIVRHPKTANQTESARQLAYRLYTLCERAGLAEEARAYNELVTSWTGIETAASQSPSNTQGTLFDEGESG
ncbi:MAG: DUF1156 domain-containing protein [Bacteroidales bacterium]|nr:DUF1156 domain-containing protein [Bacteroidales bacterium]